MNLSHSSLILVIVVLSVAISEVKCSATSCWEQDCKNCSEDERENTGKIVKCVNESISLLFDFACIKVMVSDSSAENSIDITRSCIPEFVAEMTCKMAATISETGKSIDCSVCHSDNCNSAPINAASGIIGIILTVFVSKLIFH